MNIQQKLLGGFLAVSLLTLTVSYGIGLTIQNHTIRSFQSVGGELLPGSVALSRMTAELYHTVILALHYAENRKGEDRKKIEKALSAVNTYKTLHQLYHHESEGLLAKIDESTQRFSSYITQYMLLIQRGGTEEELHQVENKIDSVVNEFVSLVIPHIETESARSRQGLEAAKKHIMGARVVLLVSIVVLMLITLGISLFISHRIAQPILHVRNAALEIARGNLDVNLQATSHDEIGELAQAFKEMTANLSEAGQKLKETNKKLREENARRSLIASALEASVRNYREIFNATNEAIILHDYPDGTILEMNQAMLDMYGFTHRDTFNLKVSELCLDEHPYTKTEALQFIRKAVEEGPQVFEWRAQRKNGDLFWAEVTLKNTVIGGESRILAVIRDISDRKEIEDELIQSQKMEAVGTLAGGIAHDFNNILTVILGNVELALRQTTVDPNLRKYLNEIHAGGIRARNLVTQILTFSRRTGNEEKPVLISSIIEETLEMIRSTLPSTIQIQQDIQSDQATLADPTQIHQIIMNLCTNAYQAMRETGGILAVSLKDVKLTQNDYPLADISPGEYLQLAVSDTGQGIEGKLQEKIFEPYFTTKKAGEGTGLGLAVVHGIVQRHNGHIMVYSEPGQGTTFHVFLPVVASETDDSVQSGMEPPVVHGTERILIVDDEEAIVNYVQTALQQHGYGTAPYTNSLQALQDFARRAGDFDLVMTDMTMPYMTGAELSQKLLEIRPDIKIILCSGFSEVMNREKAKAMGVEEYLEKPIIIETLLKNIRRVLDKPEPANGSEQRGNALRGMM